MKTNIAINTIILALLAPAALAQKHPTFGSAQSLRKAPISSASQSALGGAGLRISPQASAPINKPSAVSNILPRITTPGAMRPPTTKNIIPSTNVKLNGGAAVLGQTLTIKPAAAALKPSIPALQSSNPALGGLSPGKANAIRQGAEIANGLQSIEQLRPSGFSNDLPRGLAETSGNGSGLKQPADPFAETNNYGRTPQAPGHITSNIGGNGLTDVRGGSDNSRKGTAHGARPMSSFGRSLSTNGPRTGRVQYGADGNNRTSYSETNVGNGGLHTTTEYRDDEGNTSGYTDVWTTADTNGVRTTTDTYGADGSPQGSETVFEFVDGSIQSKAVAADGSVIVTTDDGHGHVTQTESAGSGPAPAAGSTPCDLNSAEGAALGGPKGPSAATLSGLVPLDLLRQPSGNETSGGTNTMVTGRVRNNQVNPGVRNDMSAFPGSKRNSLNGRIGGLAGPTTGGSNGGVGGIPD